jgi:steroid delta-isomerase-like uncharacterized protein
MNTQNLKQRSREFIEDVWNAGNFDRIDEFVGPDFVLRDPLLGEVRGADQLREFVQTYRRAFPDLRFSVEDEIAEGNTVVTRWISTGTHRGDLLGIAPSNQSTRTDGVTIQRYDEQGRGSEAWVNWDALGLMREIGVVPSMDEMASS